MCDLSSFNHTGKSMATIIMKIVKNSLEVFVSVLTMMYYTLCKLHRIIYKKDDHVPKL